LSHRGRTDARAARLIFALVRSCRITSLDAVERRSLPAPTLTPHRASMRPGTPSQPAPADPSTQVAVPDGTGRTRCRESAGRAGRDARTRRRGCPRRTGLLLPPPGPRRHRGAPSLLARTGARPSAGDPGAEARRPGPAARSVASAGTVDRGRPAAGNT